MFDDDVSDEDISAEALAAMFRRSREKDRAALDDFVATERSMRRDDSEGAARDDGSARTSPDVVASSLKYYRFRGSTAAQAPLGICARRDSGVGLAAPGF